MVRHRSRDWACSLELHHLPGPPLPWIRPDVRNDLTRKKKKNAILGCEIQFLSLPFFYRTIRYTKWTFALDQENRRNHADLSRHAIVLGFGVGRFPNLIGEVLRGKKGFPLPFESFAHLSKCSCCFRFLSVLHNLDSSNGKIKNQGKEEMSDE